MSKPEVITDLVPEPDDMPKLEPDVPLVNRDLNSKFVLNMDQVLKSRIDEARVDECTIKDAYLSKILGRLSIRRGLADLYLGCGGLESEVKDYCGLVDGLRLMNMIVSLVKCLICHGQVLMARGSNLPIKCKADDRTGLVDLYMMPIDDYRLSSRIDFSSPRLTHMATLHGFLNPHARQLLFYCLVNSSIAEASSGNRVPRIHDLNVMRQKLECVVKEFGSDELPLQWNLTEEGEWSSWKEIKPRFESVFKLSDSRIPLVYQVDFLLKESRNQILSFPTGLGKTLPMVLRIIEDISRDIEDEARKYVDEKYGGSADNRVELIRNQIEVIKKNRGTKARSFLDLVHLRVVLVCQGSLHQHWIHEFNLVCPELSKFVWNPKEKMESREGMPSNIVRIMIVTPELLLVMMKNWNNYSFERGKWKRPKKSDGDVKLPPPPPKPDIITLNEQRPFVFVVDESQFTQNSISTRKLKGRGKKNLNGLNDISVSYKNQKTMSLRHFKNLSGSYFISATPFSSGSSEKSLGSLTIVLQGLSDDEIGVPMGMNRLKYLKYALDEPSLRGELIKRWFTSCTELNAFQLACSHGDVIGQWLVNPERRQQDTIINYLKLTPIQIEETLKLLNESEDLFDEEFEYKKLNTAVLNLLTRLDFIRTIPEYVELGGSATEDKNNGFRPKLSSNDLIENSQVMKFIVKMVRYAMENKIKIVLASQYVTVLYYIEQVLKDSFVSIDGLVCEDPICPSRRIGSIMGTDKVSERDECVRRFRLPFDDPKAINTILLTKTSGGAGLDLSAGQFLVICDNHLNPMVDLQTGSRQNRVSQALWTETHRTSIGEEGDGKDISIDSFIRSHQRYKFSGASDFALHLKAVNDDYVNPKNVSDVKLVDEFRNWSLNAASNLRRMLGKPARKLKLLKKDVVEDAPTMSPEGEVKVVQPAEKKKKKKSKNVSKVDSDAVLANLGKSRQMELVKTRHGLAAVEPAVRKRKAGDQLDVEHQVKKSAIPLQLPLGNFKMR